MSQNKHNYQNSNTVRVPKYVRRLLQDSQIHTIDTLMNEMDGKGYEFLLFIPRVNENLVIFKKK